MVLVAEAQQLKAKLMLKGKWRPEKMVRKKMRIPNGRAIGAALLRDYSGRFLLRLDLYPLLGGYDATRAARGVLCASPSYCSNSSRRFGAGRTPPITHT